MPGPNQPIRVLLVDDHPVFREGVAAILENQSDMVLAGEAGDGAQAVALYRTLKPDVTLMDLQMPLMNGVDAVSAIYADDPGARILILTTYAGDAQAVRALKAGAMGYLLKSSLRTEMLEAIRTTHRGQRVLHRDVAEEIARHVVDDPLSARELSVLRLVSVGKSNKAVARTLGLSDETIKSHLKSIFAKLDVEDRTHAVTVALRRGFLDL